ncbi:glycoside hydrolase [Sphingomonas sp. S1-29]|uniref:glycoside hydrolase n=1 Tax=Sphingomonas sp. S1-29 TaxID=2991074 RepID=UPI00223FBB04|nr:glycoside hydrolase [Sphingomonas sp. S1-29]UZK70036.1 glycoside hydrolase [Sphingomonas sp. S1-29]
MGQAIAEQPRNRHALIGRSTALDRRISAVRPDLTDVRLAGSVFAPHYAAAMLQTASSIIAIRETPDPASAVVSEVLPGETFEMLELSEQVAWGIGTADGVVGYADAVRLQDFAAPTHRVTAIAGRLREAPDANAAVLATLPAGARLAALGERDAFLLTDHGYIAGADVAALDAPTGTVGPVAARLVGVPARAGGRSGAGVDSAGLVFLAHDLCGVRVPRFTDLQATTLGIAVPDPDMARVGDVWFFADHAAILISPDAAIHVVDRVREVPCTALLAGDHGPVLARRRIA